MELKKGYKQTDVGIIPEDWSVSNLGSLAVIKDGTHQTPNYVDFGIPFYSVEHVTSGNFTDTKYISEEEHQFLTKRFRIEFGDVLMTRIGSIGDCKLVDWKPNASFYVSLALLKFNNKQLAKYFVSFSRSNLFKNELDQNSLLHAVPKKINLGKITNLRILIPTNKEVDLISESLFDADAYITSLEKLIEKKRQIKQGAMQELLKPKDGWVEKRLGDIAEIIMGQSPLSENYNINGFGLPLIQGNADIKNRKTIIRNYTSQITKKARVGDIIMSVMAPVGEISKTTFNCCIGRGVCSIRYENDFLYHYLIYVENKWGTYSSGSTFDSINSSQVLGLKLYIPEKIEQIRISETLTSMDDELAALEEMLVKAKSIKQGIMQNLLTGKIRLI